MGKYKNIVLWNGCYLYGSINKLDLSIKKQNKFKKIKNCQIPWQ